MDVIEKAIRNALTKGDAQDRAYRENVYRSAFAALEKALKANPSTTVESAIKRRRNLQTTITEIEQLYIAPVAPAAPIKTPEPGHEHLLDAAPDNDARIAPVPQTSRRLRTKDRPLQSEKRKGRGAFATLFTTATLAAFALIGLWWGISTGLIGGSTGEPNTQTTLTPESYEPSTTGPRTVSQSQSLEGWSEIFVSGNADAIVAASNGQAQSMQDESGSFLRFTPSDQNSTLTLPVSQSILQEIAGGRAMFNIVARSSDGAPTQIAVECSFGAMGGCGRTRYEIPAIRGESLFEVDLGQTSGSEGAIHVDVTPQNEGQALDIYEVRAIREVQ